MAKLTTLSEIKLTKDDKKGNTTHFGLYCFNGSVYTGRRVKDARPFKSGIPKAFAKKIGLPVVAKKK